MTAAPPGRGKGNILFEKRIHTAEKWMEGMVPAGRAACIADTGTGEARRGIQQQKMRRTLHFKKQTCGCDDLLKHHRLHYYHNNTIIL